MDGQYQQCYIGTTRGARVCSSPLSCLLVSRQITARRGEAITADAPFLSATIIATEQRKEEKGSKAYTVCDNRARVLMPIIAQTYVIEVKKADGTTEWLERRYSDFDFLHKEIEKKFPAYNFTKLPQKHLFGNLKKDIVQGRQVMLETYLQELLAKPDVCKSDMFVRFLSSGAEKVRGRISFVYSSHSAAAHR